MTITKEFDFLCIGSGPAGQRAAVQAAKLGFRVAVIEKRLAVGGTCVVSGTIPSKTFREAVLSLKASQGESQGLGFPSIAPPTMGELLDKVDHMVRLESQIIENQLTNLISKEKPTFSQKWRGKFVIREKQGDDPRLNSLKEKYL